MGYCDPPQSYPARNHIPNLFERSGLVGDPQPGEILGLEWTFSGKEWSLGCPGKWVFLMSEQSPSARRKYFPHNLGWNWERQHGLQRWKKWINLYFPGLWTSQEEHFYLLACLDMDLTNWAETTLPEFSSSVTPCWRWGRKLKASSASNYARKAWRMFHGSWIWDWDGSNMMFWKFLTLGRGSRSSRVKVGKFRKMCGSTWTPRTDARFSTDMTYLRVL